MIYRKPSRTDFLEDQFIRCTVCRWPIRIQRTPRGGEYHVEATTTTIEGETVTVATNNGQGCPFCQSPFWDGGKAGDLARRWP